MLESGWLIPIIFMVVGGAVLFILSRLNKDKPTSEEAPKEIEAPVEAEAVAPARRRRSGV